MTTDHFRPKSIPVEARQIIGSEDGSLLKPVIDWCEGQPGGSYREPHLYVPTLHGGFVARAGDWVVKGVTGDFQRWTAEEFAATYGPAAVPSAPAVSPPVSRAAVERVVAYRSPGTRALYCVTCARQESGWKPATAEVQDDTVCDFCGECVLAVAAPAVSLPVSRAAVLREAAEVADGLTPTKNVSWYDSLEDAWNEGTWAVAAELRRMADEEQPAAACICTEDAWPPHCPCRADEYRAAAAAPAGTEETRRG